MILKTSNVRFWTYDIPSGKVSVIFTQLDENGIPHGEEPYRFKRVAHSNTSGSDFGTHMVEAINHIVP